MGARAGTAPRLLYRLAEADAFADLGLDRREAQWQARAITGVEPLPLFAGTLEGEGGIEPRVTFPAMTEGEHVVEDYVAMRLTLRSHPVALLRHILTPDLPTRRPTPVVPMPPARPRPASPASAPN